MLFERKKYFLVQYFQIGKKQSLWTINLRSSKIQKPENFVRNHFYNYENAISFLNDLSVLNPDIKFRIIEKYE